MSNATAESDEVVLFVLSREQFEAKLGSLQSLLDRSSRSKRLMSHPSFAGTVQRHEIEQLVKKSRTTYFLPGHIIYSPGMKITQALYLIESGKVQIFDEVRQRCRCTCISQYYGVGVFAVISSAFHLPLYYIHVLHPVPSLPILSRMTTRLARY